MQTLRRRTAIRAGPRGDQSPTASCKPYRLRLGLPDSPGAFPISAELAGAVHKQIVTLEWIDPLRRMPTSSPIQGKHTLTADVSNLPDVLHWLYNNKPKQFRRIESEVAKLVPNLGKLLPRRPTKIRPTLGIIDAADEDLVYSMNQMSFGTRSVVAIIAKLTLAAPGSWVCIEEPETYPPPQGASGAFSFPARRSQDQAHLRRHPFHIRRRVLPALVPLHRPARCGELHGHRSGYARERFRDHRAIGRQTFVQLRGRRHRVRRNLRPHSHIRGMGAQV